MVLTASRIYDKFLIGLADRVKLLDVSGTNPVWTRWVKAYFQDLGFQQGFQVKLTNSEEGEREFLLDLCWLKETSEECLMGLALECEWEYGDAVLYDFRKLVHMKAFVKVVVCALSKDMMDSTLDEMCRVIRSNPLRLMQESYLVINLPDSENSYKTGRLTVTGDEISSSGQRRALREESVDCKQSLPTL